MTKLVVGPVSSGLKTNVLPFNIDDDSFPTLINAYQWRERIRRKRGTSLLGRLQRYFDSTSTSYSSTATITLNPSGEGNIITGFGLESGSYLIPTSIIITRVGGPGTIYKDIDNIGIGGVGELYAGNILQGSINYTTGDFNINLGSGFVVNVKLLYNPGLPVMGLEELLLDPTSYPGTLAFDTTYSYNIKTTTPFEIYDVSFYKNPVVDGTNLPSYVPKTTWASTWWNGEDYQQFWTTNYSKALWATNGINVPFTGSNIGMQFKPITTITVNSPTNATLAIASHGLVKGDFVFVNEVQTTTGINWQTGYVTSNDPQNANQVDVTFPFANMATNGTGGIAQYLTSRSNTAVDCLRWYDGDPTNGNATTPTLAQGKGWVNFMPPLSQTAFSIAGLPPAIYYLVGARMIIPFKDRLIFIGPVVQTSSVGANSIYLQDTVIYSQNGTPYYTASFDGEPTSADTVFHPILVPTNQTASAPAYFSDSTGFGGFITAGLDQPIVTVGSNEDVLIMGFDDSYQIRFVYTGNDVIPFNFFVVNSELGSSSTFSSVNFDEGIMTSGSRGYVMTNQSKAVRFDDDILDQIFQIRLLENGAERVSAIRDFINEWVYFAYPSNQNDYKFNNQTLLYNYRDRSWAIFNESYTTYGYFRAQTGYTWSNVGNYYKSWKVWNDPWNAGEFTLLQEDVIAGNQQGFILFTAEGTGEGTSLYIQGISGNTITCPNHSLNEGDFIYISGVIGTTDAILNDEIFSVSAPVTANTFTLNPVVDSTGLSYLGGGLITRMYVPFIQTKQFPTHWGLARKTRIGPQHYFLTKTNNAQITLQIYLSQNDASPYNQPSNDALIYTTVLYTCPESDNLGLTPANSNLNQQNAVTQNQIWHRVNTSLLGDTIQLGFTLSEDQMRTVSDNGGFISQFAEIELHGFIMELTPSMLLA